MSLLKKIYQPVRNNLVILNALLKAEQLSKGLDGVPFFQKNKRYVLIVGGELFNKGAQAMTFAVVDYFRRNYPDLKCCLLSIRDYERSAAEKEQYSFDVYPWSFELKTRLFSDFNKLFVKNKKFEKQEKELLNIFKDSACMIDISGFALTSQFGWGYSLDYVLNIAAAAKFKVPFLMFPQSFGPFQYPATYRNQLSWLFKQYLPMVKKIFAREKQGVEMLKNFVSLNVEKSFDLVLQSEAPLAGNLYKTNIDAKHPVIEQPAVGIMPNARVFERGKTDSLLALYKDIIRLLLKNGRKVYLLRHSEEDLSVCSKIKSAFSDSDDVILLQEDLSCLQLEEMIRRFDFTVASRYHSIIHGYKNGIPSIVVGWAVKYDELLKAYDQMDYLFDGREEIDPKKMQTSLERMMSGYELEKEKILVTNKTVKQKSCFSVFENAGAER